MKEKYTHEEIARLAYELWEHRGRPLGSPGIDWHAERALGVRDSQKQFLAPGCPLRARGRSLSRILSSAWSYKKNSSQTLDFDDARMPRLLSVNVGVPRDVTWNGKAVRTLGRWYGDTFVWDCRMVEAEQSDKGIGDTFV